MANSQAVVMYTIMDFNEQHLSVFSGLNLHKICLGGLNAYEILHYEKILQ